MAREHVPYDRVPVRQELQGPAALPAIQVLDSETEGPSILEVSADVASCSSRLRSRSPPLSHDSVASRAPANAPEGEANSLLQLHAVRKAAATCSPPAQSHTPVPTSPVFDTPLSGQIPAVRASIWMLNGSAAIFEFSHNSDYAAVDAELRRRGLDLTSSQLAPVYPGVAGLLHCVAVPAHCRADQAVAMLQVDDVYSMVPSALCKMTLRTACP